MRAALLSHSNGRRYGKPIDPRRKQPSCGPSGIKQWLPTHGEASSILRSIRSVNSATPTPLNLTHTAFMIAAMPREFGTTAFYIIHILLKGRRNLRSPQRFSFHQCLFGQPVRLRKKGLIKLWSLLRGVGLWCIWLSGNAKVFDGSSWPDPKSRNFLWEALLDYGRIAWKKTLIEVKRASNHEMALSILKGFDSVWMCRSILGTRLNFRLNGTYCPLGASS